MITYNFKEKELTSDQIAQAAADRKEWREAQARSNQLQEQRETASQWVARFLENRKQYQDPAIAWETIPLLPKAQSDALYQELLIEDNLKAFLDECLSITHPYNDTRYKDDRTIGRIPGICVDLTEKGYYRSRNDEYPISVSSKTGWWWDYTKSKTQRSADFDLYGLWQMTHGCAERATAKLECREWLRKRNAGQFVKAEAARVEAEKEQYLSIIDAIAEAITWTRRGTRRGTATQLRQAVEQYHGLQLNSLQFLRLLQKKVKSGCQHRFSVKCQTRGGRHHTFTLIKTA